MSSTIYRQNSFRVLKRSYSLASTNLNSISPSKSLKQIKQQKSLARLDYSTKSLKAIQKNLQNKTFKNNLIQKIRNHQRPANLDHERKNKQQTLSVTFQQKIINEIKNIFTQLQIFKKILFTVRRPKSMISKLYGWDQKMSTIFFKGDELKQKICEQSLQRYLFSGKYDNHDNHENHNHGNHNHKNHDNYGHHDNHDNYGHHDNHDNYGHHELRAFYNKLRLFKGQLKEFNRKQQILNMNIKEKNLEQNIEKVMTKLVKLQSPTIKNPSVMFKIRDLSPNKQRKSLKEVLEMKNLDQQIRLNDNFELKLGQDYDKLQQIVQSGYRSLLTKSQKYY